MISSFPSPNPRDMQGLSRRGFVSKPPLLEIHDVNRALAESKKRKKDLEKERLVRRQRRREKYERVNRECREDGLLPFPSPESTPEAESNDSDDTGDASPGAVRSPSPILPSPAPMVQV